MTPAKLKFNFEGSKTPAYRRQHGEDGMVDVIPTRCSMTPAPSDRLSIVRAGKRRHIAGYMLLCSNDS